jgi:hypothetical protein
MRVLACGLSLLGACARWVSPSLAEEGVVRFDAPDGAEDMSAIDASSPLVPDVTCNPGIDRSMRRDPVPLWKVDVEAARIASSASISLSCDWWDGGPRRSARDRDRLDDARRVSRFSIPPRMSTLSADVLSAGRHEYREGEHHRAHRGYP